MRRSWVLLALMGVIAIAQSASSPSVTAHVGKGYELVQNDRFAEAAEEFRAALTLDPAALNARYQLGICLFALGERDAARQQFERLQNDTHNDPSVVYYLARIDLLGDDYSSAVRRLQPLMSNPPFPDAPFYLASAYLGQSDLDNAVKWLRVASRADPRDFRSHYRLARVLREKGAQKESEQEYALSAELREHYNETARQSVACVRALQSSNESARNICRALFDANDPDKLTTLGMLLGENGRYADAIEPLAFAARLDPDSFEVYHNLGLTYFRLRRFSEARPPLEKAVNLRPDFFGSNALLGATLFALKDDLPAYRVLEHAHRLKPEDKDTAELLFRVSVVLANKSAGAGDYEASLNYLNTAATLRPGAPELDARIAEIRTLRDRAR
jgi:tetratricopeptide (TPR) repeat protein